MLSFVYRLPLWIVFSTFLAVLFLWAFLNVRFENNKHTKLWKAFNVALLIFSVYVVLEATILNRNDEIRVLHLEPFRLFSLAQQVPELYRSMLMNVALFFPFGISCTTILPKRLKAKTRIAVTFFLGLALSIFVEILQYTLYLGETEIDDVICNGAGAFLGTVVLLFEKLIVYIKNQKHIEIDAFKFLAICFSITWICWAFLSYFTTHGPYNFAHPVSIALHIMGGFGPFVAGVLILNDKSFKEVFRKAFIIKTKTLKYFFIFAFIEILVISLSSRTLNTSLSLYNVPFVFIQATFIYGGNEELGWRGTLQPIFEKKYSFPLASLITGLIWSIWHLPLWYVIGASQQNMSFMLFTILGVILSFWFSSLYKKTKSVFLCSILHGLTNTLLSLFDIKINAILLIGLTVMLTLSIFLSKNITERN